MKAKKQVVNFLILTIAGIINATAVVLFLIPLNLIDGGFSGTSFIISTLTPKFISLSVILIVINFPFYIFGYKKLGKSFVIYSLYTITVYSLMSFLLQYLTRDVSGSIITLNDMLLSALFGGLISGIGSGLTIRVGGALDGVEVLSVIFSKRLGLSVGMFVMIYNIIIYTIAGVMFQAWTVPLYSIIAYAIGLKAVDFIVEGIDSGKGAMIITSKSEEMCEEISNTFSKGITIMPARGYYFKEEKSVIYIVVNRFQINRLKKLVKEKDSNAFVTIMNISEIMSKK